VMANGTGDMVSSSGVELAAGRGEAMPGASGTSTVGDCAGIVAVYVWQPGRTRPAARIVKISGLRNWNILIDSSIPGLHSLQKWPGLIPIGLLRVPASS